MVKNLEGKSQKAQVEESQTSSSEFYSDDVINRPRPKRDKFSSISQQMNLPYPQRTGFRREWVLEKFLPDYEVRDWKPVRGDDGKPMRRVLNSGKYIRDLKEPEYGIYMEIPEHFFKENRDDDDAIRKELVEKRMNNTDEFAKDPNKGGGTYVPTTLNGQQIINKVG